MRRWIATILVASFALASVSPAVSAQISQPDIIQEHWYHSYATLTLDLNAWADEHPDIVNLLVVGETELGRNLWMLQISDWSLETKPDGTAKEVVYIDGGHHGNEHLGTELAFITAEYYIEGWSDGEQDVIDVLSTTELHILIMLNADGNDFDTRWNVNQVDLNRNYDHYWNTCPTTQPGSSAFSESETLANSIYMNDVVPDEEICVGHKKDDQGGPDGNRHQSKILCRCEAVEHILADNLATFLQDMCPSERLYTQWTKVILNSRLQNSLVDEFGDSV